MLKGIRPVPIFIRSNYSIVTFPQKTKWASAHSGKLFPVQWFGTKRGKTLFCERLFLYAESKEVEPHLSNMGGRDGYYS